jgi:endonuclease-3 related protein
LVLPQWTKIVTCAIQIGWPTQALSWLEWGTTFSTQSGHVYPYIVGEPEIREYYRALLRAWGPQDWWPAHTRFEVIVGAYLTQNTAWTNVERALRSLRNAGLLSLDGIRNAPLRRLEKHVRSAGYFRQKAQRLKNFVKFVDKRYQGSLARMFARPTHNLREELLSLNGVGPETADSILLYAGGHPVFVVDAYTRRIFERHGLVGPTAKYEEIRKLVEHAFVDFKDSNCDAAPALSPLAGRRRHKYKIAHALPAAVAYDEFHALLVQAAKHHCMKGEARCDGCPLEPFLTPTRQDGHQGAGSTP